MALSLIIVTWGRTHSHKCRRVKIDKWCGLTSELSL